MLIKYAYNNNDIIHKNEAPKSIIKYRGKYCRITHQSKILIYSENNFRIFDMDMLMFLEFNIEMLCL